MKKTNILIIVVYAIVAGLVLLSGVVYPQEKDWSYWAAGAISLHGFLSLFVAMSKVAKAAQIAAGCWLGISAFLCSILLLIYARTQQGGWLLGMATLAGLNLVVILAIVFMLKPNSVTGR